MWIGGTFSHFIDAEAFFDLLLLCAEAMKRGMLPSVAAAPTTTRMPSVPNDTLPGAAMANILAPVPSKTKATIFWVLLCFR